MKFCLTIIFRPFTILGTGSFFTTVYIDSDNFKYGYDIVKFCKEIGLDFVCLQGPAVFTQFSPDGNKTMKITDSKKEVQNFLTPLQGLSLDVKDLKMTRPFFNLLPREELSSPVIFAIEMAPFFNFYQKAFHQK